MTTEAQQFADRVRAGFRIAALPNAHLHEGNASHVISPKQTGVPGHSSYVVLRFAMEVGFGDTIPTLWADARYEDTPEQIAESIRKAVAV